MKRWLPLLLARLLVLFWCLLLLWSCQPALAQQPDTRPHAGSMRFNKLRAGNLTSCPTGQFIRGFDPRTSVPLCDPVTLPVLDPTIVTTTGTQIVRNKQNVPREVLYTPVGNAITPDCDTTDVVVVNALAANLTVNNPVCTGTNPVPSQEMDFRFYCSASRSIFWGGGYAVTAGVPYLNTCTGDGTLSDYAKVRWNSRNNSWEFLATRASGPGISSLASATTFTCNVDASRQCQMSMTGASGTLTIAAPTGSPTDGQMVLFKLLCTNSQALVFNSIFVASANVAIPGSCPADTTRYLVVGVMYTTAVTGGPRWQIISTN